MIFDYGIDYYLYCMKTTKTANKRIGHDAALNRILMLIFEFMPILDLSHVCIFHVCTCTHIYIGINMLMFARILVFIYSMYLFIYLIMDGFFGPTGLL